MSTEEGAGDRLSGDLSGDLSSDLLLGADQQRAPRQLLTQQLVLHFQPLHALAQVDHGVVARTHPFRQLSDAGQVGAAEQPRVDHGELLLQHLAPLHDDPACGLLPEPAVPLHEGLERQAVGTHL